MNFKKYTKTSLSISLTIVLSYGLVSAWTNLTPVSSGNSLTDTIWNEMVIKLNDAGSRSSGIFTDGSGKIGIGTNTPTYNVDVVGSGNTNILVGATTNGTAGIVLDGSDGDGLNSDYMYVSQTNDLNMHIHQGLGTANLLLLESGGNVGIGSTSAATKLEVAGKIIRTLDYATNNGPNDELDSGQITSRILNITKEKATTKLRISYTDNLRVLGIGKACRWEIKIDGVSCSQPLVYDYYTDGSNILRAQTLIGYCSGITTGSKQIQIWVNNVPGYTGSDCYTGWSAATWVIESEEVN